MKLNIQKYFPIIILFGGCNISNVTTMKKASSSFYSILIGKSKGGIIEESIVDAVTGATPENHVDAVSGATETCFYFGLHKEFKLKNEKAIETGIDIIAHKQSVIYNDSIFHYHGELDFNYLRLSIPITYNFNLLKKENSLIQFKAGLSGNYMYWIDIIEIGSMPNYSLNNFALSPLVGISFSRKAFGNYSVGAFFNTSLYKGTKVFKDEIYNISNKTGLLSTLEFGLIIKMGN